MKVKVRNLHPALHKDVLIGIDSKPMAQADKKTKPYADIGMMLWNEGYAEEIDLPTLHLVEVPKRLRGKGMGEQMLLAILRWMRRRRVQFLAFDNFEEGFWGKMKKRYPKNIVLSPKRRGSQRVGFIRLSDSVKVDNLLW